ncbi:CHAT domain-containing protein [Nocardia sp. NRRL S-836]|uniref:CHAT domain-containing protein n=1 Tax=Nocardia sp. NRRL S-836 TaxID=1519492 RepID=UPI0006B00BBD|nr:CHAT domain-containing protein [Nocardia sp. NRRL S-836]KOV86720.1 hypothetical protein ADL03_08420 [Nocardia sp. NRRL S-836]
MESEFRARLEAAEALLTEFESSLDDSAPVDLGVVEDIRYYLDWVLAVAERSSFDWVWAQYLSAGWFRCQGRALADPSRLDEAITAMRIVVDRLDDVPGFRIDLVDMLQLRYSTTDVGDRELLADSVHELRRLVEMELDEEDRALAEAVMGMTLREQFRRARADDEDPPPELLDEAQRYLDNSLDLPGMDDGLRVETMLELARLRSFRSVMDGTPYVLDAAVEEAEAIPLYEQVAPNDPNAAFELAEMMASRFLTSGDLRERNGALRWLTRIEGDPRLDRDPAEVATLRGELLLDRAKRARDELPELITYLSAAVEAAPGHGRLGIALLEAHYLDSDVDGMLRSLERLAAAGEDGPEPEVLLPLRALALATKALRGEGDLAEAGRVVWAASREPTSSGWTKNLVIVLAGVVEVVQERPGVELGDVAGIGMSEGFSPEQAKPLLAWLLAHETGGVGRRCAVALLRKLVAEGQDEQLAAMRALDEVRRELDESDDVALVLLFQQALVSFDVAYQTSDGERVAATVRLLDEFFAVAGEGHPLRSVAFGVYGSTLSLAHLVGGVAPPSSHAVAALTAAVADEDDEPEIRARFLTVLAQAELLQSVQERGDLYESAAGHCRQAMSLVRPGTEEHDAAWQAFATVLLNRFQETGDLRDQQAGISHLQALRASLLARGADVTEIDDILHRWRVVRGETGEDDDMAALRAIAERLARVGPQMDAVTLAGERALLAQRLLNLGAERADKAALDEALGQLSKTLDGIDRSSAMFAPLALSAVQGKMGVAVLRRDWVLFDEGVAQLEEIRDDPEVRAVYRSGAVLGMAVMWHGRHLITRTSADLDEALRRYEQVELFSLGSRDVTGLLDSFADSCWKLASLGYGDNAISIGFDSLQRRAGDVLLQSDSEHAVERAADAAARGQRVALRCAVSGELERAVEVVEWGRGLVLHSTTTFSGIGARLRALGHDDLAEELRRPQPRPVVASPVEFEPSDLRRRVLSALGGEFDLLRPPPVADIAKALRALDADALVHLVPGQEKHDGRAFVTTSEGVVREVLLPLLVVDGESEVGRYSAMDDQERRRALPSLCAWAWRAVVEPLLRAIGRAQPWLVLVPTGVLGVVPWHAAAGTDRVAIQEAGFTYATSAKQLCDLAQRRHLPVDSAPVVVSNPDGTLVAGQYEAQFLHRLHPAGRYYGQPGPGVPVSGTGTPDEVLAAWDSGVSLLHLGCHARAGATPAQSALVLARAELSVDRMLRHAAGRAADTAGGLVVLAACESDLTAGLHDEALTLAAAYVAIGAAGVVGTKWRVDDIESALLMCVFYDFLHRRGMRPRDALRAAQLWALDHDRKAPEGVDTLLRGRAGDRSLTDPVKWAAFAHHGW